MFHTKYTKYLVVVAAMAAMFVAATTTHATDSAFAQENSVQATSEANDCGNGQEPINVLCQDLVSQLQGDNNDVYISGDQEASSKIVTEPGSETGTEEEATEEAAEDAEFE